MEPRPFTTLSTPGGSTPSISFMNSIVPTGVKLDGFNTTQFPAASAGASFQKSSSRGTFHAQTAPTTPIGSRMTMTLIPHDSLFVPSSPERINAAK